MTTVTTKPPSRREAAAQLQRWERYLARNALTEFCQFIDPAAAANYGAAHLRRIAERLEAVERGEIKRLYIAAPPRHWKSSLVSEKFPSWWLGRHPAHSVIIVSHAQSLSEKFSRTIRDTTIANQAYRELFPTVRIREDHAGVSDWSLHGAIRSSCRAIGVGGGVLGLGGNLIIIDDPVADAKEAFSKSQRDAVWLWYQNTLRYRLEPDGVIVLVSSRWHQDDLAGRNIKSSQAGDGDKWEVLHLPAINAAGEALWPARWPIEALLKIKTSDKVGARAWAAQFQGDPRPEDGTLLDSTKLVMVDESELPPMVAIVRAWDLAFSDKESADFLAGCKMGIDRAGNRYILHLIRVKGRWTEGKLKIIETALSDGSNVTCSIESNGTQLGYFYDIQADTRMRSRRVVSDKPQGDKEMRASMWGSRLCDRIVKCVRGPWNQMLFDQMDYFPSAGEHDDLVDSVSAGWAQLGDAQNAPAESVHVDRHVSMSEHRSKFAI